jgi:hypothetical protein
MRCRSAARAEAYTGRHAPAAADPGGCARPPPRAPRPTRGSTPAG